MKNLVLMLMVILNCTVYANDNKLAVIFNGKPIYFQDADAPNISENLFDAIEFGAYNAGYIIDENAENILEINHLVHNISFGGTGKGLFVPAYCSAAEIIIHMKLKRNGSLVARKTLRTKGINECMDPARYEYKAFRKSEKKLIKAVSAILKRK